MSALLRNRSLAILSSSNFVSFGILAAIKQVILFFIFKMNVILGITIVNENKKIFSSLHRKKLKLSLEMSERERFSVPDDEAVRPTKPW